MITPGVPLFQTTFDPVIIIVNRERGDQRRHVIHDKNKGRRNEQEMEKRGGNRNQGESGVRRDDRCISNDMQMQLALLKPKTQRPTNDGRISYPNSRQRKLR